MKKLLPLLLVILSAFAFPALAQTTKMSEAERTLTDSLCNCVSKLNLANINTKQQAVQEYTGCVGQHLQLLQKVANEKGADMNNLDQMRSLGIEIAQNLVKQKCDSFTKLSVLIAEKAATKEITGTSTGVFKRIDIKGFNYIVLNEDGNEKSYIWYKQFAGSEEFTKPASTLVGKKVTINWVNVEVYLPAAKGYYTIKEITNASIK